MVDKLAETRKEGFMVCVEVLYQSGGRAVSVTTMNYKVDEEHE